MMRLVIVPAMVMIAVIVAFAVVMMMALMIVMLLTLTGRAIMIAIALMSRLLILGSGGIVSARSGGCLLVIGPVTRPLLSIVLLHGAPDLSLMVAIQPVIA